MRAASMLGRSFIGGLIASAVLLAATSAQAMADVSWRVGSISNTTAQPGEILDYRVQVKNVGTTTTGSSPYTLTAELPPGFTIADPNGPVSDPGNPHHVDSFLGSLNFKILTGFSPAPCTELDGSPLQGGESEVKCESTAELEATQHAIAFLSVDVDPAAAPGTVLSAHFEVSGGAAAPVSTVDPTTVTTAPPPFGIDAFESYLRKEDGTPYTRAGGHAAFAAGSEIDFNTKLQSGSFAGPNFPVEPPKDNFVEVPAGLVGNPGAVGSCTTAELAGTKDRVPDCPTASQLGTVTLRNVAVLPGLPDTDGPLPLFQMVPPPGVAARFGFNFIGTLVLIDALLRPGEEPRLVIDSRNISEGLALSGVQVELWGVPYDPAHDPERACPGQGPPSKNSGPTCKVNVTIKPFLRMPTSCTAPGEGLPWKMQMDSWYQQGTFDEAGFPLEGDSAWKSRSVVSHQAPRYPHAPSEWGPPVGITGCEDVPVNGEIDVQPTTLDTESASGLQVHVEVPNPGIENAAGVAASDIKKVKLALPQGVTINPSQAEGLGTCSAARYESTVLSFHPTPGRGCPDDSKIGTVEVHTPLLTETIPGNVYIAQPNDPNTTQPGAENPFDSLLAIYVMLEEPQRGILIKLPGKVETDEATGKIVTTFDDLPQLPFSTFDFKFREGARAPLVTPPTCGTYTSEAEITGWSDPSHPIISKSSFETQRGIGGGPCPPGGTPGFKPSFSAGSINNNAKSFSPFDMRLTRSDGEQDMTRFSAVLPPGVLGKLAGVSKCPDSALTIAKAKSGKAEQASPSCPSNSQIGRSLVGAGVGSVLTYIPGKIYLGGAFHGDPLSVIAITPAVAGPFDVGTVVVHEALTLNPKTAEVEVDGSASDPIPHILKGIPAKVRDIRVYVDRPDFILNPTSCDPSSARATLFGGGGNAFSSLDDVPVSLTDRYQAANCSSLGFKPKLSLKLKGGTRRGAHPALAATYTPRKGDANIKGLVVRLPSSAFLDQGHIRTICTRVQFAAKSCPAGARYGFIKAWTPLLEEPLEGPVWLRSSNHKLPDLVFDLHGLVDVEVATRIDSAHGGIRATVEDAPDAPITKVLLRMQGAKKGLIVNSRNLCRSANRADVRFDGQNGKSSDLRPLLKPTSCAGKARKQHRRG